VRSLHTQKSIELNELIQRRGHPLAGKSPQCLQMLRPRQARSIEGQQIVMPNKFL
jgi:hypothetical protein